MATRIGIIGAGRSPEINSVGQGALPRSPTLAIANGCRVKPCHHHRALCHDDARLSALMSFAFRFVGRCPTLLISGLRPVFALANLALLAAVLLAGCATQNPIVGRWVGDDETTQGGEITFFTDGSLVAKDKRQNREEKGTYSLEGKRIKTSLGDNTEIADYNISGENLTVTTDDGETFTFRKAK